jgi:hypothetical protein
MVTESLLAASKAPLEMKTDFFKGYNGRLIGENGMKW